MKKAMRQAEESRQIDIAHGDSEEVIEIIESRRYEEDTFRKVQMEGEA